MHASLARPLIAAVTLAAVITSSTPAAGAAAPPCLASQLAAGVDQAVGCVPPPPGLVGWWPGDGNARDIVAGHDGKLRFGATFGPGEVSQAFTFDGSDDNVLINSTFPFHQPGDATLDFWLNTPATSHQSVLWTRPDDTDASRFNIFVNGNSTFGLITAALAEHCTSS
jgi:hypothetical protein